MESKRFMVNVLFDYHFSQYDPGEVTFDYEPHYFDTYEEAAKFAEECRVNSKFKEVLPECIAVIAEVEEDTEDLPF